MFEEISKSIKSKVQPYIKKVPGEEVFIGTILFYVIFSLAFFMCDHNNIECVANIINFYNSWIIVFAVLLYMITANVFCCVIGASSFLASSLAEVVLGTLYYPSRMFLSTYLHHIVYSLYGIMSLYFDTKSFSFGTLIGYLEVTAILQSIKRIWNVKNMVFDIVNAVVFFLTRIVLLVPFCFILYLCCETSLEKYMFVIPFLCFFLHVFWSWTQFRNLIRRYFSGSVHESPTDISELYLTPNSVN
jgi:hypothetical protein